MENFKFIPIRYDKMYKKIFIVGKDKRIPNLLIKETSEVDSEIETIIYPEIINFPYKEKNTIVDLIARLENKTIVGIELNTVVNKMIMERNFFYMNKVAAVSSDQAKSYDDFEKQIQVNLNFEGDFINPIDHINLIIRGTDKIYLDSMEIIRINIPYFVKLCYNKDVSELSIKERLLGMIGSEDIELSKKLAKGDEILEMILKKQIRYSQGKSLGLLYNKDELMKASYEKSMEERYEKGIKEGKIEGINEGRLEGINEGRLEGINEGRLEGIKSTVKNMLKEKLDVNLISKVTGLSINEINGLR